MKMQAGHVVLSKIADALGLQGQAITRIVLDVAVKSVPKLYIERYASGEECEALATALKIIELDVTSAISDGIEQAIAVHAPEPGARVTKRNT